MNLVRETGRALKEHNFSVEDESQLVLRHHRESKSKNEVNVVIHEVIWRLQNQKSETYSELDNSRR